MIRCAEDGTGGVFNAVSPPGHTRIEELLETCRAVTALPDAGGTGAELVWRSPQELAGVGVTGWVDLPIWVPPTGELAALHEADVTAALRAGLLVRPVAQTVRDTWTWLAAGGAHDGKGGRGPSGLTPEQEEQLLAGH